jgi:hypothetical protein
MRLFNPENAHWYRRDGEPLHSVSSAKGEPRPTTLRDARKLGLLPSVTNVLGVINKPELVEWKMPFTCYIVTGSGTIELGRSGRVSEQFCLVAVNSERAHRLTDTCTDSGPSAQLNSLVLRYLRMEARVGIEGRTPSALLLRAQFRLNNTGS